MNPILQNLNKKNNPNNMFSNMLNSNPQFRQFVEENKGKSPEQIAKEHGIDYNEVIKLASRFK